MSELNDEPEQKRLKRQIEIMLDRLQENHLKTSIKLDAKELRELINCVIDSPYILKKDILRKLKFTYHKLDRPHIECPMGSAYYNVKAECVYEKCYLYSEEKENKENNFEDGCIFNLLSDMAKYRPDSPEREELKLSLLSDYCDTMSQIEFTDLPNGLVVTHRYGLEPIITFYFNKDTNKVSWSVKYPSFIEVLNEK